MGEGGTREEEEGVCEAYGETSSGFMSSYTSCSWSLCGCGCVVCVVCVVCGCGVVCVGVCGVMCVCGVCGCDV